MVNGAGVNLAYTQKAGADTNILVYAVNLTVGVMSAEFV